MERASDYRDHGWIGSAVVVGFGAVLLHNATKEDQRVGWSLISAGISLNIGLHVRANAMDRKAARIIQGKPIE